jgi:hypothetical protein
MAGMVALDFVLYKKIYGHEHVFLFTLVLHVILITFNLSGKIVESPDNNKLVFLFFTL